MYESREQAEPTYDAKGTETVRRDTCPAVSKVSQPLENMLALVGEFLKKCGARFTKNLTTNLGKTYDKV